MFEDMKRGRDRDIRFEDASDREILYRIWTAKEIGDLSADQAWAELYRRYPQEPRFLLLNAFEELAQPPIPGVYTPDYVAAKATRMADASSPDLYSLIADFLSLAEARLGPRRTVEERAAMNRIKHRVIPRTYSPRGADTRLSRFQNAVIREYHNRSLGGEPFFPPPPPSAETRPPAELETAYSRDAVLSIGDRVRHPKFGVGTVESMAPGKVRIAFPDGTKTLAGR